ncbi:MAG: hypothetical protein LBM96_02510 [Methanobrevibacter sp.]|jgi:hypothetical protein|nr:hypothetical protein [Candidatus Methanoflexus mossambicus]
MVITSKPYNFTDLVVQDALDIVNSYGKISTNSTSMLDGKIVFFADYEKVNSGVTTQGKVILMVAKGKLYTINMYSTNNLELISSDIATIVNSFEPLPL